MSNTMIKKDNKTELLIFVSEKSRPYPQSRKSEFIQNKLFPRSKIPNIKSKFKAVK